MTSTPRRGFLGRLTASLVGLGALPALARAESLDPPLAVDEAWMDALKGKYRQVFDCKNAEPAVTNPVKNFLNAYRDAYGMPESQVNAVVGFHGGAANFAFTDDAWARYRFGQQLNVMDPATRMPALKNPLVGAAAGDIAIGALQQRGVTFLLCNNSLGRVIRTLVAGGYGTEEAIRADLTGKSLLPGFIIVPSMVVTFNRLQQRGVSYVSE
jgi:intracellular sulfur oxidation DsrE/DsrF family protein